MKIPFAVILVSPHYEKLFFQSRKSATKPSKEILEKKSSHKEKFYLLRTGNLLNLRK
jgi:hypothetical protein